VSTRDRCGLYFPVSGSNGAEQVSINALRACPRMGLADEKKSTDYERLIVTLHGTICRMEGRCRPISADAVSFHGSSKNDDSKT
jgi:hypothetical protein